MQIRYEIREYATNTLWATGIRYGQTNMLSDLLGHHTSFGFETMA